MINFGNNLKLCREVKGVTQSDLASVLKVPQTTISRYERNEVSPSVNVAYEISKALSVPISLLMAENLTEASEQAQLEFTLSRLREILLDKGITNQRLSDLNIVVTIFNTGL